MTKDDGSKSEKKERHLSADQRERERKLQEQLIGRIGEMSFRELKQFASQIGIERSDDPERDAESCDESEAPAAARAIEECAPQAPAAGPPALSVRLTPPGGRQTTDLALWRVIKDRTEAIGFNRYSDFINAVMCGDIRTDVSGDLDALRKRTSVLEARGRDAYKLLKMATEAFLMQEAGLHGTYEPRDPVSREQDEALYNLRKEYFVDIERELRGVAGDQEVPSLRGLPYFALIRRALSEVPIKSGDVIALGGGQPCYGIIPSRAFNPILLELIWSYWYEEAGLVQGLNAITLRFQNKRAAGLKNALSHMATDPLRPLNNLLWGYVEDESQRLSLARRSYEYAHHYGLPMQGKAVPTLEPIDNRRPFLKSFHTLLHLCSRFYREADDATVVADGFPILNNLKETHLLLAQGAHNQYGDLPWTARVEMLMQKWLLARPEMREFLPTRVMVPYQEPWMGRLETMRQLQGWGSHPVTHFRDLAMYGEQILLSIRFSAWTLADDRDNASNWALFWRPQIQSYIHAYRSLTGVDLTGDTVDFTPPSELLRKVEKVSSRAR